MQKCWQKFHSRHRQKDLDTFIDKLKILCSYIFLESRDMFFLLISGVIITVERSSRWMVHLVRMVILLQILRRRRLPSTAPLSHIEMFRRTNPLQDLQHAGKWKRKAHSSFRLSTRIDRPSNRRAAYRKNFSDLWRWQTKTATSLFPILSLIGDDLCARLLPESFPRAAFPVSPNSPSYRCRAFAYMYTYIHLYYFRRVRAAHRTRILSCCGVRRKFLKLIIFVGK